MQTPVEAKFQTWLAACDASACPTTAGPAGSCQREFPNFDSTPQQLYNATTPSASSPLRQRISTTSCISSTTATMAKGKGGGGGDNLGSKKAQGQARKADAANAKKAQAAAKEEQAEASKWEKGAKSNAKAYVHPSPHRKTAH